MSFCRGDTYGSRRTCLQVAVVGVRGSRKQRRGQEAAALSRMLTLETGRTAPGCCDPLKMQDSRQATRHLFVRQT